MAKERKKPFSIEIPVVRQEVQVLASEKDKLNGKLIKLDMTRMLRGRSVEATFAINKNGEHLESKFIALNVSPAYIRRMMRKNISWIEDSFLCKSKDFNLRIKPFMITKKRVPRSVRAKLRDSTKDQITKIVESRDAALVFEEVVNGRLQREVMSNLRKVYPLAFFEVRVLKIEK